MFLMSTLKENLQSLLTVQTVDSKIQKVKEAIDALDSGAHLSAAYNKGKTDFDRLKATALNAEKEQQEAEERLQNLDTKIQHENELLFSGRITVPRELENLQMELDMLERQRLDAENKVLRIMETASQAVIAARDKEAQLRGLAAKYKAVRAAYKAQRADLDNEMQAHETERAAAAKDVPAELIGRYESIRSRRHGVGVVMMLDNGACGGCYTLLSKGLSAAVRASATMETCEFCGRFLVPPTA